MQDAARVEHAGSKIWANHSGAGAGAGQGGNWYALKAKAKDTVGIIWYSKCQCSIIMLLF